jgi:hypothetical protein
MNGLELIDIIASATGLPKELAKKELARLASSRSINLEDLKIDHLREILAAYLQETLLAQIEQTEI